MHSCWIQLYQPNCGTTRGSFCKFKLCRNVAATVPESYGRVLNSQTTHSTGRCHEAVSNLTRSYTRTCWVQVVLGGFGNFGAAKYELDCRVTGASDGCTAERRTRRTRRVRHDVRTKSRQDMHRSLPRQPKRSCTL